MKFPKVITFFFHLWQPCSSHREYASPFVSLRAKNDMFFSFQKEWDHCSLMATTLVMFQRTLTRLCLREDAEFLVSSVKEPIKKCHSDRKAGNRKAKASTPQYMENTKLCVREEQISASLQATPSAFGRSTTQTADHCSIWVPPQSVLQSSEGDEHSKAACRASAREDSSPGEENKALCHSPCHRWPSWQLTCHPCCLLAIKAQILHGDLAAPEALGWCWGRAQTSTEVLILGLLGTWSCVHPSLVSAHRPTQGSPSCWRNQLSLVVFGCVKTLLCTQQGLKAWYPFSDIPFYMNILARYSILP